ncbi:MAG: hypothetical protein ABI912_05705 [Actinomycetota bacterium]
MTRVIRTVLTTAMIAAAATVAGLAQVTAAHATGPFPPQAPSASKPAVFRNGTWYFRASTLPGNVAVSSFKFGQAGDIPVMGDWNGDGTKTVGVVRGRIWYIRNSNSAGRSSRVFSFGRIGDVPLAGDWDGNGTDTPAVARCTTVVGCSRRVWYARNTLATGPATSVLSFGGVGKPIVADWDNLGGDTPGLVDANSNWTYTNSWASTTPIRFHFGTRGDKPVVGDWGVDNQTSVGVVRNGTWLMGRGVKAGGGVWSFPFGRPTDIFLVWE